MKINKSVVSDVDGMVVIDKQPMDACVKKTLGKFKSRGVALSFITGAPLVQAPKELFCFSDLVCAEHGAVKWQKGKIIVFQGAQSINVLRQGLGITIQNGYQKIKEGTIIVEGPRQASLTLLFGHPPHYPLTEVTADSKVMMSKMAAIIEKEKLPIELLPGHDGSYNWIDAIATTKRDTIQRLIDDGTLSLPFFYMGDKANDLEVMQINGVTPIAFPNCMSEIIVLARQKGIYIPYLPYRGGIVKLLEKIVTRV